MTGYTVHTGSTVKFSTGWDRIFGSKKKSAKRPAQAARAKSKSTSAGKKS